jgi:hypothetical protein
MVRRRRAATKEGNKEAYMQAILQKNEMQDSFNQQIVEQIFEKMGITHLQYNETMMTHM